VFVAAVPAGGEAVAGFVAEVVKGGETARAVSPRDETGLVLLLAIVVADFGSLLAGPEASGLGRSAGT
jgi:hypothetical protein